MKSKIILIIALAYILAMCKDPNKIKAADKISEPEKKLSDTVINYSKKEFFHVSGSVSYVIDLCPDGANYKGAIRTIHRNKEKGLVGYKLYFRRGIGSDQLTTITDSIITDKNGKFNLLLPAGIYMVFVKEQMHPIKCILQNYPSAKKYKTDLKCLAEWWDKPQLIFTVFKDSVKLQKINLVFNEAIPLPCPCIKYPCIKG